MGARKVAAERGFVNVGHAFAPSRLLEGEETAAMSTFIVTNWKKISLGILALTLLGAGGYEVRQMVSGGCGDHCAHGSGQVAHK
jgi:hypothetical protein